MTSNNKQRAIERLLKLCSVTGVDVPEDLRQQLLKEVSSATDGTGNEQEYDDKGLEVTESNFRASSLGTGQMVVDSTNTRSTVLSESTATGTPQQQLDFRGSTRGDILTAQTEEQRRLLALQEEDQAVLKEVYDLFQKTGAKKHAMEIIIQDGSYTITNPSGGSDDGNANKEQHIETVGNANPCYQLVFGLANCVKRCIVNKGQPPAKAEPSQSKILENIQLKLESGKTYLLLGAPGSGKSTLLKYIANTLTQDKTHEIGGKLTINGISPSNTRKNDQQKNEKANDDIVWSNLVCYVDQIDRLYGLLTVKETCDFSWRCRTGGTHAKTSGAALVEDMNSPEVQRIIKQLDEHEYMVNKTLDVVGLSGVKDTFVGDRTVRGVSGGQKKRVTVSEMAVLGCPIRCFDEISTGLDAATTYDITRSIAAVSRLTGETSIVSLLQPPPETVALFDDLILMGEGKVVYAGPVVNVVEHFESLGYSLPDRVDTADWLQALVSKDGKKFLLGEQDHHYTANEFSERFYSSKRGTELVASVKTPNITNGEGIDETTKQRYRNSWYQSLSMVTKRELLLWWRDKYSIKARIFQDLFMGIITGTLFWQQNSDPASVMGVLFQSMMFLSTSSMTNIPGQIVSRTVFYKEQDANMYPTWTFIMGRTIATFPSALIDSLVFGSLIYWLVGLAFNDGASILNYFIFLLLMLMASFCCTLFFGVSAAVLPDVTSAQGVMGILVVIMLLFSGFTVQPDVIPGYWIWVYWINIFAWILRALAVNEYQSGKYSDLTPTGETAGSQILINFGFSQGEEAFEFEWIWWGVAFAVGLALVSALLSTCFLSVVRYESGKSLGPGGVDGDALEVKEDLEDIEIAFQKASLSFRDIYYTVTASTSKEKLQLLSGVTGNIEAGKMTALMGSSGAGKTTLMDVLALRKSGGEITGQVYLNGHLQEPDTFRRCTGYVEQFDIQSPQLTVRESVAFSALLRLTIAGSDQRPTSDVINKFVDQSLAMLELTGIQHLQVGNDEMGGLSFEQQKRLSIAVEVAANPSILFLDEPTSGLDARAASIAMRGMRRIASSGRAVCATIHQPSIAIFNSFDSLLLLKRGGEVIFHGDLGSESSKLIEYFEGYEATTKIQPGENPATWMLMATGAGSAPSGTPFDYGGAYAASELHKDNVRRVDQICEAATSETMVTFPSKYATSENTQQLALLRRTMKLYWRNPSYNMGRIIISIIISLLYGSVYVSQRTPTTESDMNSRVTTIFMGTVLLASISFNAVLDVFEFERNMFYKHRDSLMYSERAILLAFTVAEVPFIILSSMTFQIIFYFMCGFAVKADKFFIFYLFLTLNLMAWTFIGQMLVALLRDSGTAQGVGTVLNGLTALFTGVLIRPENIPNFYVFFYWLLPGHYCIEGLLMSQFNGDTTFIEASPGTSFWDANNCSDAAAENPNLACGGTAGEWIETNFGSFWSYSNVPWNALYFVGLIVCARVTTLIALMYLNYRST